MALHGSNIAAGFIVDMGALYPCHSLGIVAFSGVLRVMGAQIVLRGRKGHHGKILHHHGQCQQTAQQLLRSFILPHNKSS